MSEPGGGFWRHLRGALALDRATYREIAERPRTVWGALLVVITATALAGAGGLLWTRWGGRPPDRAIFESDVQRLLVRSVLIGGAIQVGMWAAMVLTTLLYVVSFGVRVTPAGQGPPQRLPARIGRGVSAFGRFARPMGYAFAPVALELLICPPGLEMAAGAVALGYTFAAMVAAVRGAVDISPGRAAVSVLAGFALFTVVLSLLGNGTTDLAPGIFSLDPLPTSIGFRTR